jgi:hypothetical protein
MANITIIFTKRLDRVINTPAYYSGVPGFKFLHSDRLFIRGFPQSPRQMPG